MLRQANKSRSIRQIARRELFLQISSPESKPSFPARSGGTMLIQLRCKPATIICRHCARFLNNANVASGFDKECQCIAVLELEHEFLFQEAFTLLLHYTGVV